MQLIGRLWTLLAPEIVHAILAGTLQKSILINKLSKTMPERRNDGILVCLNESLQNTVSRPICLIILL